MVTNANPLQPEKAYEPIFLTELGIVIDFKQLQQKKALSSIFVTESGIVMLVSPVQPLKASFSITVVPFGMMPTPLFISYFATNLKYKREIMLVYF